MSAPTPRVPRRLARVALLAMALVPVAAVAQVHPRLLFGPEDIPALREKITREPYKTMFETLLADVDTGQYRSYAGPTPERPESAEAPADPYGEGINGLRSAFLYVLTGEDRWAQRARFYVERRINDTTLYRWANASQKGLNLYFVGKNVALTYDLCHGAPSWDATFTAWVSQKMLEHADVIATNGGTEQNTNTASNWQGLRGSSAGLLYLAADLPYNATNYTNSFNRVRNYLRDNLGTNATSRGWNIEGIGYLGYPMASVAPFMVAARRASAANDLFASTEATKFALWSQYAATVRFRRGEATWILHPDFGDDNATADDANGMYGFAFQMSDPALVPGLRWWYDRLLVPEGNWDYTRGGTIFSILYYRDDVPAADPLTLPRWRDGFNDAGGNGYFTFRNAYRDEQDLVGQLYVKLRGDKGHSGPDALSFRIFGLNTAFAVGGGRYGVKTNNQDVYWRSMNTLYPVDPDATLTNNGNSGSVVGTPVILSDGGGAVVASIGRNNVGTNGQKRWFAADHSRAAGVEAVYVVADTSTDGLFWQFNTLDENTIEAVDDRSFLVRGQDGATMKGTVVYPPGPHAFAIGERVRGSKFAYGRHGDNNRFVHFRGAGDYVVVLTAAKAGQEHPPVSLRQGRVAGAVVDVGPSAFVIENATVGFGTTPPALPAAPGPVQGFVARGDRDFREARLAWSPTPGASGYIVHRSADGGATWVPVGKLADPAATGHVDPNLPAGASYRYRVQAYNDGGDGPLSPDSVAAVTAAPSAAFVAHESFEGLAPGPVAGRGAGSGWTGPWTTGGALVVDRSAAPLAANGVSGGDRALQYVFGDIIGTRLFASPPNMATGVWMSWLLRYESGTYGASGEQAWIYSTRGNRDWGYVGVDSGSTGAWRASSWYTQGTTGGPAIAPGTTYHVVTNITNNRIRIWINPASANDTPAVNHAFTDQRGWGTFPGIGLSSRSSADTFLIDRIVVATSFADAVAGPPAAASMTSWAAPLPAESRAADADPDRDGVPNALAWALGGAAGQPLAAERRGIALAPADGVLALRFPLSKDAGPGAVRVEAASAPGAAWTTPAMRWNVVGDTATEQWIQAEVDVPADARTWLLRLRAP